MQKPIRTYAEYYLKNGYSVIPVKKDKNPVLDWGRYSVQAMSTDDLHLFDNAEGIALVCGYNNVTCIDIDSKYDLTGTIFSELKEILSDVWSKLAVHITQNGGYHLIFRCEKVEGNQKLASRHTTEEEKRETLKKSLEEYGVEVACRSVLGDKIRVLIETRGKGGYCLIPPTMGYSYVEGKISSLTLEEYEIVIEACKSFNSYIAPPKIGNDSATPYKDFNKNFDMLSYLEKHGWTSVGNTSQGTIKMKRPGRASSKYSGYYDPKYNNFWVFTTSTSLTEQKKYSPYDLVLHMDFDGDVEKFESVYFKNNKNEN